MIAEIQVPKGASIAELKEAVVKAFGQTQEEEQTKISWYGVVCKFFLSWFCLIWDFIAQILVVQSFRV